MKEKNFAIDNFEAQRIILDEWQYLYCYPAYIANIEIKVEELPELQIIYNETR
jgi:hypothetical protein